jgi:hypothetical protein
LEKKYKNNNPNNNSSGTGFLESLKQSEDKFAEKLSQSQDPNEAEDAALPFNKYSCFKVFYVFDLIIFY